LLDADGLAGDEGKTLYEVAGQKPLFEAAGIVEIDGIWSDK
jgi:4-hydroxy-4-methyl-2-oxoglutarate aldolase